MKFKDADKRIGGDGSGASPSADETQFHNWWKTKCLSSLLLVYLAAKVEETDSIIQRCKQLNITVFLVYDGEYFGVDSKFHAILR
jgi:hypothetical protein